MLVHGAAGLVPSSLAHAYKCMMQLDSFHQIS